MNKKFATLLIILAASLSGPAPAAPLGRLFFTPEQRVALDRQRLQATATTPAGSAIINGMVQRSSGHHTIWINGKAITEKEPLPGGVAGLKSSETLTPNGLAKLVQRGEVALSGTPPSSLIRP